MHRVTRFITGASSGIGRAATEQLLARGDRVAATARTPARLELACAPSSPRRSPWVGAGDVERRRPQSIAILRREVTEELTCSAIAEQVALNLVAPMQLTRAVLSHLRAQGGGRIIQTSTTGGPIASAGGSMYHASKWGGVEGFFESIIAEVAPLASRSRSSNRAMYAPTSAVRSPSPTRSPSARTPRVGQMRQYIEASGGNLTNNALGDQKVAAAIIASAQTTPTPGRLTLGSDAYHAVHAALSTTLAELEASRGL